MRKEGTKNRFFPFTESWKNTSIHKIPEYNETKFSAPSVSFPVER